MGISSLGDPQKWLSESRHTFGMTGFDLWLISCMWGGYVGSEMWAY